MATGDQEGAPFGNARNGELHEDAQSDGRRRKSTGNTPADSFPNSPDLPQATHAGERQVGGWTIPVFNLNNGDRVISERGFLQLIGAKGRGSSGGHRLARILADPAIKLFFSKEVLAAIANPISFLTLSKTVARGYSYTILKDFCVGFSRARINKALITEVQNRYAEYCENLLYAFADMGIAAWIDEATGFQRDRARDALHKILEKYVASHWATWSKTFPDEFYEQIYRLKGLPYEPGTGSRPGFIGHLTNDVVYARLAPGVLEELRKKNPTIDQTYRRQRKHHQWLTRDVGHPDLKQHIRSVTFMMRGFGIWDAFYRHLQRSAPKLHETAEFDFGNDY